MEDTTQTFTIKAESKLNTGSYQEFVFDVTFYRNCANTNVNYNEAAPEELGDLEYYVSNPELTVTLGVFTLINPYQTLANDACNYGSMYRKLW